MKGTFSALDLGSASDLDLESGIDLDLGSASDLDLGEEDETKERKRRCLKLPGYKGTPPLKKNVFFRILPKLVHLFGRQI